MAEDRSTAGLRIAELERQRTILLMLVRDLEPLVLACCEPELHDQLRAALKEVGE